MSTFTFPTGYRDLVRLDLSQSLAEDGRVRRRSTVRTKGGAIYRAGHFLANGRITDQRQITLHAYAERRLLPIVSEIHKRWDRDLAELHRKSAHDWWGTDPRHVRSVEMTFALAMDVGGPRPEVAHLIELFMDVTFTDGTKVRAAKYSAGGASYRKGDDIHLSEGVPSSPRDADLRRFVIGTMQPHYKTLFARIIPGAPRR